MNLHTLFDPAQLHDMLAKGMIRRQFHPSEPLAILNYTERAVFTGEWNGVARACRGLIYNTESLGIIARPFPKFFSYDQIAAKPKLLGDPPRGLPSLFSECCVVTDKLDGSLGILYAEPSTGQPAIATRRSFTSDQAIHATKIFRDKYSEWFWHLRDAAFTYLFEIIYPANRIVLDYGDRDDLAYLGSVCIQNGFSFGPGEGEDWPGEAVKTFGYSTFAEALAAEPRENAEGLVAHFPVLDMRVKIKQADYIRLHKIITNTSARSVWEALKDGKALEELTENVPDEFHDWVEKTARELATRHRMWTGAAASEYMSILASLEDPHDRKAFAQRASRSEYRAALFWLYDGRSVDDLAWKAVKPEAEQHQFDNAQEI